MPKEQRVTVLQGHGHSLFLYLGIEVMMKFFKGDPAILVNKKLKQRAWRLYCHLGLVAGTSRLVKSPEKKAAAGLGLTADDYATALAEIEQHAPGFAIETVEGLRLAEPPQRFLVAYRWIIEEPRLPDLDKRLFFWLLNRQRQALSKPVKVNFSELIRRPAGISVPGQSEGAKRKSLRAALDRLAKIKVIHSLDAGHGRATTCWVDEQWCDKVGDKLETEAQVTSNLRFAPTVGPADPNLRLEPVEPKSEPKVEGMLNLSANLRLEPAEPNPCPTHSTNQTNHKPNKPTAPRAGDFVAEPRENPEPQESAWFWCKPNFYSEGSPAGSDFIAEPRENSEPRRDWSHLPKNRQPLYRPDGSEGWKHLPIGHRPITLKNGEFIWPEEIKLMGIVIQNSTNPTRLLEELLEVSALAKSKKQINFIITGLRSLIPADLEVTFATWLEAAVVVKAEGHSPAWGAIVGMPEASRVFLNYLNQKSAATLARQAKQRLHGLSQTFDAVLAKPEHDLDETDNGCIIRRLLHLLAVRHPENCRPGQFITPVLTDFDINELFEQWVDQLDSKKPVELPAAISAALHIPSQPVAQDSFWQPAPEVAPDDFDLVGELLAALE